MKNLVLLLFILLSPIFLFAQLIGPNFFSDSNGYNREYYLYIPDSLPPNSPIVYVFHGWGGSALGISSIAKFNDLSDTYKFVVCYPNALIDGDGGTSGLSSWNTNGLSDVDFILSLNDSLTSEYEIDVDRVFATGNSYGAEMSHHLARCQGTDIFAAIATVSGSIFDYMDICSPSNNVSVFVLHGTDDVVISYDGGTIPYYGTYLSIPEVIDSWVNSNSCELTEEYIIPNSNTQTAGPINVEKYINNVDYTRVWLYSVVDFGHNWPTLDYTDIEASEEIWNFFMEVSSEPTNIIETSSPQSRTLVKVTDILGRDISNNTKNQIVLYIYDDGTVEKRFEVH